MRKIQRPGRSSALSRRAGRSAIFMALLGCAVFAVAAAVYWAGVQLDPVSPASKRQIVVKIPKGLNAVGIAGLLADKGVLRSRYSFLIAARLDADSSHLKPGIYVLSPGQSAHEIVAQIAGGRTSIVRVTFPEGFTVRQIAVRLQERKLVDADEFVELAKTIGRSVHCPDGFTPPSANLEGYLFPDTYDFAPTEDSREIITDMVYRFDALVVKANPNVSDWTGPVIVGSLIEREAEVDRDRPLIAAVIDNRLEIGMPLQIDASVEYALPVHKTRLMFSDLKTRSPYNTYLHRGLPRGAICNPGIPSIRAALHPADVDYLYYVAGPGGAHIFSRTLAQQDRNIALVRSGHVPS